MTEFRSKLEDLMAAEELPFPPTSGFGPYKRYLEHATSHPAKMNTLLLEFLVKAFSEQGDTLLDPMAGSGSLGVVAALHQRNAVQVELEKKFWDWMEKAKENVMKEAYGRQLGWIKNICGDARRLSELLGAQSDAIITSPPYSETLGTKAGGGSLKNVLGKGIVSDGKPQAQGAPKPYSTDEVNIGNLPHGSVDAIISSPPYLKSADCGAGVNRQREGDVKIGCATVGRTVAHPDAIDNTKEYGDIDAVITSPPYSDIAKSKEGAISPHMQGLISKLSGIPVKEFAHNVEKLKEAVKIAQSKIPFKYSDNQENIGNLPHGNIDCCITSPPYENAVHCRGHSEYQEKLTDEKSLFMDEYGSTKNNIGNLKRETYLGAMLKVYWEMFRVLKPFGLAVIVVKPFIRNKRVVDLPYHTWLLMAKAGFRLARLYKLRLRQQSFWRILFYKKHPDVPLIAHEYVIVAQKPDGNGEVKPVEPKVEPAEFLLECIMEGKI